MRNESKCSTCIHSEVCPHQDALAEAQKKAEELLPATSFPFLKPIVLECKHYFAKIITPKGDSLR